MFNDVFIAKERRLSFDFLVPASILDFGSRICGFVIFEQIFRITTNFSHGNTQFFHLQQWQHFLSNQSGLKVFHLTISCENLVKWLKIFLGFIGSLAVLTLILPRTACFELLRCRFCAKFTSCFVLGKRLFSQLRPI